MSSESVCQVARSWVDVGSFHTRLVVRFMIFKASVRNILNIPSYIYTLMQKAHTTFESTPKHTRFSPKRRVTYPLRRNFRRIPMQIWHCILWHFGTLDAPYTPAKLMPAKFSFKVKRSPPRYGFVVNSWIKEQKKNPTFTELGTFCTHIL
jgi:hypothetical protein